MSQLAPSLDTEPAAWIVAGLQSFGRTVVGLVPAGFAAYVRVFHPAYRRTSDGALTPVPWRAIAEANGRVPHPAMQLIPLTEGGKFVHRGQPDVYDHPPREQSLPAELVSPLIDVLERHTTTPGRCWFAVWNGFGATRADVRSAPTFHVPSRDYHLLVGPIGAASETMLDPPWNQSANLWWPDDHSWCVATEIDLDTTYIGCDEACRREILDRSDLEVAPVSPDDGITWRSDPVNPRPRPE
jgi:hypothetical protein